MTKSRGIKVGEAGYLELISNGSDYIYSDDPTASGAYDVVFDYIMPLAIPMVLLEANIKRIIRESGHAFILMNVACLGAVVGGIAVGFLFRNNFYFAKDIAAENSTCSLWITSCMVLAQM